jgi:hypothetical protein
MRQMLFTSTLFSDQGHTLEGHLSKASLLQTFIS